MGGKIGVQAGAMNIQGVMAFNYGGTETLEDKKKEVSEGIV